MTAFDLDLRHPQHISEVQTEYFPDMTAEEVMNKFNTMNWKQLQILMLQIPDGQATFTVTDNMLNQTVKVSLIELPQTEVLAFHFESDIEVEVEQKNLFGLLKYHRAMAVELSNLSLKVTRELLDAFTHQELEVIKQHYLRNDQKILTSLK